MSLMVSISGIRGIVGESLTPETVVKYASAFSEYCDGKPIVIGRDGRTTGKILANLVSSTLLSSGSDVLALGICPTPTVQLAVERFHAAGGISITASHNPMQWNGMKFIAPTGLFLDASENRRFWSLAEKADRTYARWDSIGKHQPVPNFIEEHIEEILRLPFIDLGKIRSRKLRVALDCVNAAGGTIIPQLLERFGCEVVAMNCDCSGVFAHDPEPIPENLKDLCELVRHEKADIGLAVDPDVDRLVLIDEHGTPLGEEYTIASVIHFILGKETARLAAGSGSQQPVVVNLSTTRAVDDIAGQFRVPVIRTPVGEINVAKKMKEVGALIGGEGSGGVILSKLHLGRDAPVGVALALQHLVESGGTVSEMKKSLPQYEITKSKFELGSLDPDRVFDRLVQSFSNDAAVNQEDGLKLDFSDSWIHIRASNTEPILRLVAEGKTKREADALVTKVSGLIQSSRS